MSSRNATSSIFSDEDDDDDKAGVNSAPIILCFVGCVIIEGVCLLAFHIWKKISTCRRSGVMSHGTCHLQPLPLRDVRFHLPNRRPVISFTVAPDLESRVSDNRSSSPPPYNQIVIVSSNSATQSEEPPPPYEEVVKHYANLNTDKNNRRKLSC